MEDQVHVSEIGTWDNLTQFAPFPKIARLNRDCVITEKIDGTNAQVIIAEDGTVRAASRTRLVTPLADNYGFATWVMQNAEALTRLGPGRHFGEWWGTGIQRKYDLAEKRFSLFNVHRWEAGLPEGLPANVHVVPVIYRGPFSSQAVTLALETLKTSGSQAAPGFKNPEGIVVFHTASSTLYKVTIEGDEAPKGLTEYQKQVKIVEEKRKLYDEGKLSPDAAREFLENGCAVGTGLFTIDDSDVKYGLHDSPE